MRKAQNILRFKSSQKKGEGIISKSKFEGKKKEINIYKKYAKSLYICLTPFSLP